MQRSSGNTTVEYMTATVRGMSLQKCGQKSSEKEKNPHEKTTTKNTHTNVETKARLNEREEAKLAGRAANCLTERNVSAARMQH